MINIVSRKARYNFLEKKQNGDHYRTRGESPRPPLKTEDHQERKNSPSYIIEERGIILNKGYGEFCG